MENDDIKRIRLIIKNENLTILEFAKVIEVSSSTLNAMFQRNTKPSFDVLKNIANAYPHYSLEWIITGKGDMLKNAGDITNSGTGNIANIGKTGNINSHISGGEKTKELENKISELEGIIKAKDGFINQLLEELRKK